MKKLQFLTYLFSAILMVTAVSCDDDDDDDDGISPDKEAILTADTWNGNKIYYQGVDVTEDFADFFDVQNSTLSFQTDGTYVASMDGDSDEGTWEFNNEQETEILMDAGTADEMVVDVNRLTSTELWVEGDFMSTGGTETVELRFVR